MRAADPSLGQITLVSDGGESKSDVMSKLCSSYNVAQQFTCYDTPEHNSFIERVWRTIGDTSTAMLLDSNKPEPFWEEAWKCAQYIYNRIPPRRKPKR